jgi:sialic acid synthase SpsE
MVQIGKREIGDHAPCFITFEAGPTHNGLESAKRLVKYASDAGGDAIKFQIFDPDALIADKALLYTYKILIDKQTGATEEITEPLHDIFVRRALTPSEWKELKAYSDELGLAFFATIGDEETLDLVTQLGVHSVKIASADVNHLPFIRQVARTGTCVQLDTGNATFGEIEVAVDVIRAEGNNNIIIHNCPSGYPARLESINLNMIPTLKKMFNCPAAYSDHSPGFDMDIAAVALGANLVEKTITEDRTTRSVEHIMSLEPQDMKAFIQTIRDVEVAMGQTRRVLHDHEKKSRLNIRRSTILKEPIKQGQCLRDAQVVFKRPGYGIAPDQYETMLDHVFTKDLPASHVLSSHDLIKHE